MAATLTPVAAYNYALQMIKSMPLNNVEYSILTDASSLIWMAAPWRWSTGVFGPVGLSAGVALSDTFTALTDFVRLEKLVESNDTTARPIQPAAIIPSGPLIANPPNFGAYVATSPPTIRFDSLYPPIPAGETWKLWGWYKKTAPIITVSNASTAGALVMDDEYFWVYNEAVLYYALKYADDARAGSASVAVKPNGQIETQYSGQLAITQAAIEFMKRSESLVWAFPEMNPNPILGRNSSQ